METPNVPRALALLDPRQTEGLIDIDRASYFLSKIELTTGTAPTMARWRKRLFIATSYLTADAAEYFGLPRDRSVIMGSRIEVARVRKPARLRRVRPVAVRRLGLGLRVLDRSGGRLRLGLGLGGRLLDGLRLGRGRRGLRRGFDSRRLGFRRGRRGELLLGRELHALGRHDEPEVCGDLGEDLDRDGVAADVLDRLELQLAPVDPDLPASQRRSATFVAVTDPKSVLSGLR
jgi:hypothetical protein